MLKCFSVEIAACSKGLWQKKDEGFGGLRKGQRERKRVGGNLAMVRVNLRWHCGTRQGPEHGSGVAFDSYYI